MIEFIKVRAGEVLASFSVAGATVTITEINHFLTAISATVAIVAGIVSIAINMRKTIRDHKKK